MALDHPDSPLAVEIQQEKAAAYFAACKKMVDALQALADFDRTLVNASTQRADQPRHRLIDHAAERVFFVIIQREAMKLSWYEEFFEDYAIPPEVRARVGRARR